MAELSPTAYRAHRINALFNLLGGGFSMLTILVIPFLLNRWLSQADYASWVLGFQVAMYIPLLGFGIHQILMRSIAHGFSTKSSMAVQKAVSSGFFLIALLVLMAIGLVLISVHSLPLFLKIAAGEQAVIESIWIRVGCAAGLGLLALFYFGAFGAIARFEWENSYKAIVAVSFIGFVLFLQAQNKLTLIAIADGYMVAVALGLSFLTLVFLRQKYIATPTVTGVDISLGKQFIQRMVAMSAWQLNAFLVAGLDIWIIARIAFDAIPGYSFVLALVTVIAGITLAFLSPCLPRFTQELSKSNQGEFKIIFLHYQKRLLQITVFLVAIIYATPEKVWMFLFQAAAPVFLEVYPIILIATFIRMLTVLYQIAIISTNLQHRVILPLMIEGISNVVLSIFLGLWLGPIGVALGTLIGALICFVIYALHTIPACANTLPVTAVHLLMPWRRS